MFFEKLFLEKFQIRSRINKNNPLFLAFLMAFPIAVLFLNPVLANTKICILTLTHFETHFEQRPSIEKRADTYSQVDAAVFFQAFSIHKNPRYHKGRSLDEFMMLAYQGSRFYLNKIQNAGYGITIQGELISVFNGSNIRGLGAKGVAQAIQNGARFLHCLEPLKDYFSRFGFVVEDSEVSQSLDSQRESHWRNQNSGAPKRIKMVLKSNSNFSL